jgi:transcriptional/translational regulatory protein YebC/TACO1
VLPHLLAWVESQHGDARALREITSTADLSDPDLRVPEAMMDAAAALEKSLGEPESVKAVWRAQNSVPVDPEKGATLVKLLGLLEDDDDIQDVYTNTDMSDEEMESFGA